MGWPVPSRLSPRPSPGFGRDDKFDLGTGFGRPGGHISDPVVSVVTFVVPVVMNLPSMPPAWPSPAPVC